MARVTAPNVLEIVQTQLENIDTFIYSATNIVDRIEGLDEETGYHVELYLAAHFIAVADKFQRQTSSKTGDASDTFTQAQGDGFMSTLYGQQALALDSSGTLKAMSAKKKVQMWSL